MYVTASCTTTITFVHTLRVNYYLCVYVCVCVRVYVRVYVREREKGVATQSEKVSCIMSFACLFNYVDHTEIVLSHPVNTSMVFSSFISRSYRIL